MASKIPQLFYLSKTNHLMLVIEDEDFKVEFHRGDIANNIKSNPQEMSFLKKKSQKLLVSKDVSENFTPGQSKVRLVVALTTNDETKLHLLELNNESWQISLERELPEGHILNVFTSDNTTLLVTPTHCILLDENFTVKQELLNKSVVHECISDFNEQSSFLF